MREGTRRRSTNLFQLAALFAIIVLGIDLAVTLLVTNEFHRTIFSDVFGPIVGFLASTALFAAAKHSASHSKCLAAAWGLIGLSTFIYALGDTTWAILELGLEDPPFPSLANIFYLAYYPLLLTSIFLLPNKPATRGEQINQAFDGAIVMVAAILAFWNFLLGPIVFSNAGSPFLEQAILLAYPVGDLV